MEEFMKKFFVLLGTLAAAALFFSCANSSSDNSAALLGLQNNATKTTVSKTIKIGGVEYSYTIVDGQPQASGGVSVAADGTVTITAADGSKVAVKGETITYTTADSKVYVGSGSSGDITLVNQANPNDKITAAVTSQTKTESPQQQQSEASRLPPSVGTNELAGKTFKLVGSEIGSTYKFETDTYTLTTKNNWAETENNSAYIIEITYTNSYTYDSNSKVFYKIEQKGESAYIRNGAKLDLPKAEFSTDEEFIAFQKKYYTILYDRASADYIATQAKQMRHGYFMQYGYTDTSCETPVSNEIIAKYNEAVAKYNEAQKQVKHFISTTSYSVSDTVVKFGKDTRYPAGKDFSELFNYYKEPYNNLGQYYWDIKDNSDNTAYALCQANGFVAALAAMPATGVGPSNGTSVPAPAPTPSPTPGGSGSGSFVNASTAASTPAFFPAVGIFAYPNILKSDGLLIYKVSSVDANAIHTCATGTRADTNAEFSFTDENKEFKYTMTKSENGAVVDIEGLGKINIVYATPATIPDFTSAPEYTLQQ